MKIGKSRKEKLTLVNEIPASPYWGCVKINLIRDLQKFNKLNIFKSKKIKKPAPLSEPASNIALSF